MAQSSKEYAEALFSLAVEKEQEQEYFDAVTAFSRVLKDNPEYAELLSSPAIAKKERVAALEELLKGRVPSDVLCFLSLLCERGKIRELPDCVREYDLLLGVRRRTSTATVVSAVALTEEEKQKLQKKLEAFCRRRVVLVCRCDPSLIGGITVTVDGQVLDGSLKRRLQDVKEVIQG
ncbi:MAG TPA: ATP synthase F1 subunit delta [Ruminococcaceae bacterium]|nr:ATP synthase F1 subunit delta [Oscillospiraceae bacterium]